MSRIYLSNEAFTANVLDRMITQNTSNGNQISQMHKNNKSILDNEYIKIPNVSKVTDISSVR